MIDMKYLITYEDLIAINQKVLETSYITHEFAKKYRMIRKMAFGIVND